MAVSWTAISVILMMHLVHGVNEVKPLAQETSTFIAPQRDLMQHWVNDLEQQLFNERTQLVKKEDEQKDGAKQLAEKQGEKALLVIQAHEAGLVGDGPFEEPPAPTLSSSISSWWNKIHEKYIQFNQGIDEINKAIEAYRRHIQLAKTAIATATKRIEDLQGLRRSYQEEVLEKSFKPEVFVADIRQSPWLGTVLVLLHATLIPITVALALSSLLRVMVLAERLTPVRLVSA